MLNVELGGAKKLNVLLLGAHCDDIEIGCGGTFLRLVEENKIQSAKWVVFTSTPERRKEAQACAEYFLKDVASKEIVILDYKDTLLPESKPELKKALESFKTEFLPDVIFTHHRHDLHQDHKVLAELTWNSFRNHLVLEYEIPKYDGDLGHPNFFVSLHESVVSKKIQALLTYYVSQKQKHWFDAETFLSLLRVRGLEIASLTRYAEAFHVKKVSF